MWTEQCKYMYRKLHSVRVWKQSQITTVSAKVKRCLEKVFCAVYPDPEEDLHGTLAFHQNTLGFNHSKRKVHVSCSFFFK